jgi:N-carbamoylputrescine amidase
MVIAKAPAGEETILYTDIDLDKVERSHARRLFLRHRRPELYGRWI